MIIIISIHSSHTGRDGISSDETFAFIHFNPLFPYGKRRATTEKGGTDGLFQSTLPIREETYTFLGFMVYNSFQSTLPIREETVFGNWQSECRLFQSTLPIREETNELAQAYYWQYISIHSSHTGRDGRRGPMLLLILIFQSTLPIREETKQWEIQHWKLTISIHSSHTGRDYIILPAE